MRVLVVVGLDVAAPRHHATLARMAEDHDGPALVAYLQLGEPSLAAALADLATDPGVTEVLLVGAALGGSAPAASWLGRVAAHHVRERAVGPQVLVASAVVREDGPDAIARAAAASRPVRATGAPLTSSAWERVPSHRHQVLVCRGPRCSAQGADVVAGRLDDALRAHGLEDDDVLVTQTGCQFPCNHAPVVSVQPDDVWYGPIGPADVGALVEEHLVAGRPLEQRVLPRSPGDAQAVTPS